jgi:phosphoglycolate phosphatase-like HAD superfamily hydrolase
MNSPDSGKLVFLDFDGVICDSLPECYAVSLDAYYNLYLKTADPATQIPAASQGTAESAVDSCTVEGLFRRMRPYIRRGGDYLFIQLAIHKGIRLESQADFDALVSSHHELDDPFHEIFYKARNALFRSDPARWYSLNPLYPGLREFLLRHSQHGDYLILSTKEAGFISEILRHHGIDWNLERIYCSGKERKLGFIDRIMDERGGHEAVFIDDQVDHFAGRARHPVRCLLADWGYIIPQWLTVQAKQDNQPDRDCQPYEVLNLDGLDAF